jgi:murein hydrolase activator
VIRQRLTRLGLTSILLLASSAAAAATAAGAREELRELRGKIEALQNRLASAEESKNEAVDALRESERAISEASRSLRDLAAQSRAAHARIEALRAELKRVSTTIEAQQALLARLAYQQYVSGRSEPLKLLLNRENPNQMSRQLHYFGYLSRARAELIGDARAGLARGQALAQEAAVKAAEIDTIAAEQKTQKRRLEGERKSRAQVLARISREVRDQQREIGTLKRNENRLAKLVEQLGRLVSRPRASPRLRNDRLPDASTAGSPFEQLRGRLALPVRGELANRFGSPRSDGGLTWKGLFIAARAGEEVKAIAAGRVVFADWLRGFGNLLIVDHGGAYMSLYGNNETLYKRVGDEILGGETVAAVGSTGGNSDSGLYFEVRHQGKPLDPLTWVDVR